MRPTPRPGSLSQRQGRIPRSRPGRKRYGPSLVSFEADPDLLSFDHHLLAVEIVGPTLVDCDRQGLVLDIAGVAVDRPLEHPIRLIPGLDTGLHVEPGLVPAILDGP